ncbi:unnamed protein product [Closterium sp. NIES-54]
MSRHRPLPVASRPPSPSRPCRPPHRALVTSRPLPVAFPSPPVPSCRIPVALRIAPPSPPVPFLSPLVPFLLRSHRLLFPPRRVPVPLPVASQSRSPPVPSLSRPHRPPVRVPSPLVPIPSPPRRPTQ